MLYAYDDEDNAPMIDGFMPNYPLVYKSMKDLGFDEPMKIYRNEEPSDD